MSILKALSDDKLSITQNNIYGNNDDSNNNNNYYYYYG